MSHRHPDRPAGQPPARLSPDQVERIVQLSILGHTSRHIAAEVGCTASTAQARWKKWQAETLEDRRANMEEHRTTMIARLDCVAVDALKAARTVEPGSADHARMLNAARGALSDLSRVAGFDAPKQIQMAAAVTMTEAEALAILGDDA